MSDAPRKPTAREELRRRITLDRLQLEVERAADQQGEPGRDDGLWIPALAQIRISKVDLGGTASPERQLRRIAEFCATFGLWPAELCFEAQSGYLTDKRPRKLFEAFRQRIEDGSLLVRAVVCLNIDRFTRDRLVGETWLRMLKQMEIDLHEAEGCKRPRPLPECEKEYAEAFIAAWHESNRKSQRIRDQQDEMVREGRIKSGLQNAYGHQPVYEDRAASNGEIQRVQVGGDVVSAEAQTLEEASMRVIEGEPVSALVRELRDRQVSTRSGKPFTGETLRQVLKSPRLAGLQAHRGELVKANIEPILDRADWDALQERLRPRRGYRRDGVYALSGLGFCGTCGAHLTGSTVERGGKRTSYYTCSRRRIGRYGHAPNSEQHDSKHPTARVIETERLLVEAALAVRDHESITAHAERALEEREKPRIGRREELEDELGQLDRRRLLIADNYVAGAYTRDERDKGLASLGSQRDALTEELSDLAKKLRSQTGPRLTSSELRERVRSEGPPFRRQVVSDVIERFIVHPAKHSGMRARHEERIEIVWHEAFEPPAGVVEALQKELADEGQRKVRLEGKWSHTTSREDEKLIYTLYAAGNTTVEIAQAMNESGRPTPKGGKEWTDTSVRFVSQRACERRGLPYVPRRRDRGRYDQDTRDKVYEAYRISSCAAAAITDLGALGIPTWDGSPWTSARVQSIYASECARRGIQPCGRKRHLPESTRRQMTTLRRGGKTYREIAEWANAAAPSRPNGRPWDSGTVRAQVISYEGEIAKRES